MNAPTWMILIIGGTIKRWSINWYNNVNNNTAPSPITPKKLNDQHDEYAENKFTDKKSHMQQSYEESCNRGNI